MPDELLYALKIHSKSDVDFDTLLKFNSLCIERAIRSVNNERV